MSRWVRAVMAGVFVWSAAQAHAAGEDVGAALEAASRVALDGPQAVALAGQARLQLPALHRFVPQPQAGRLLNAMGNPGRDPHLHGLIFPLAHDGWFMTVRFEPAGYVRDDDAKSWNADELLQSYREGTEASNGDREKLGVPAIEVLGWAEKPAYDASAHRLVWAMSSREKGSAAGEPQGVNYNTYVLGREGYFQMNLVTGLPDLAQHKPAAQALLAALAFDSGKSYADYNASTDRTAEYGLAALVLGVGAKKLGLLAIAAAFFAKFAKLIVLALIGLGALVAKYRGKRAAAAGESSPPAY